MRTTDYEDARRYEGDGIVSADMALKSMLTGWMNSPTFFHIVASAEEKGAEQMAAFWLANAFKYLWRWPLKGGTKDLKKAVDCIERARYIIEEKEKDDDRA